MSFTKRCTSGWPATAISALGTVKLCGRNREPRPAIGTIIFICYYIYCFSKVI